MTGSPDFARLGAALDHALSLSGPDREAFLATLPPALREAVEHGLAEDPLLDRPEAAHAALAPPTASPVETGIRLGPYRLEALVGEGGMGRVYRARRADGAFDKTVAVKVVRQSLALAGTHVAARLRRERDLLATLDHPGIARLVDGGETADGIPYLVTEFVDGQPLTAFAESRQLGLYERIRLIVDVARAVDHAHRRFVLHRDLKPGNVLVTERDGETRPVVLDFGIAKLLDAAEENTGAFTLTQTGMRLLTPAYAAPELFDPTLGVTVAADVYGLGALLYELLTGQRPHPDSATPPTTEPARPSRAVTQASSLNVSASPTATSVSSRALQGDLDTICLKALHPDPSRRYASASDLADDLERHLDGRPVEARPDSLAYVAGRFARRNRVLVGAAAVVLIALVSSLGLSLSSLAKERVALAEAEKAIDHSNQVIGVLTDVFESPRQDRDILMRDALATAADRSEEITSSELRGYIRSVLGNTLHQLGNLADADSILTAAVHDLEITLTDKEDKWVLPEVRRSLAQVRAENGDFEAALYHYQQTFEEAGGDPYANSTAYHSLNSLPWMYRSLGRHDEAIQLSRTLLDLATQHNDAQRIAYGDYELGASLATSGQLTDAALHLRRAKDAQVALHGEGSYAASHVGAALGAVAWRLGDLDEAMIHSQRWADASLTSLGPSHPQTQAAFDQLTQIRKGAPPPNTLNL